MCTHLHCSVQCTCTHVSPQAISQINSVLKAGCYTYRCYQFVTTVFCGGVHQIPLRTPEDEWFRTLQSRLANRAVFMRVREKPAQARPLQTLHAHTAWDHDRRDLFPRRWITYCRTLSLSHIAARLSRVRRRESAALLSDSAAAAPNTANDAPHERTRSVHAMASTRAAGTGWHI